MTLYNYATRLRILQHMAPAGTKRLWFRSQLVRELGLGHAHTYYHVASMLQDGLLETVTSRKNHVPLRVTPVGLKFLENHRDEMVSLETDCREEA